MKVHRTNGATMALYASFLVLVGIPLLALTVDVTRAYLAVARLRGATEAGCLSYVRSVNTKKFIQDGETALSGFSVGSAYEVFVPFAPKGSTLEIVPTIKDERVVALCTGRYSLDAIIPLIPSYQITSTSAAKADFATTKNW
jgi:hypothetical protein